MGKRHRKMVKEQKLNTPEGLGPPTQGLKKPPLYPSELRVQSQRISFGFLMSGKLTITQPFNRRALMATITVDRAISAAPNAGESSTPRGYIAPAAMGIAKEL